MPAKTGSNGAWPQPPSLAKKDKQKIRTVAAEYDTEHNGAGRNSNAGPIQSKFIRSDSADVPAQQAAGSTLPLVLSRKKGGAEDEDYNPFDHRVVEHPTSDTETLIHLLKGSLGSGILAMPMAFLHSGLWFGLAATMCVGLICTYGVHLLVKCAHTLCRRRKIPMMGFADVAEQAFLDGPPGMQRWSRFIRFIVNTFLVLDLLGCCCIYLVFVAKNVKQVVDFYVEGLDLDVRIWIAIATVPLIFMCLIKNLKYLVPFSMVANVLLFVGIIMTFRYIFTDLPPVSERVAIRNVMQWPLFFGTVIFALEGIGVVMSLENDMKNPAHFIGCPSVLNIGMGTVIVMYTTVGFFGYWRFGAATEGSITLNLPVQDIMAQLVKLMIALAIFFTFTLQFYVPMTIIWRGLRNKIPEDRRIMANYLIRIFLVLLCGGIAIALPNLGPFISLIGAVCLSTLGLIVPATVEMVVYRETPGYGRFRWRLWKDILLVIFGLIGFFTGTYVSILEFYDEFTHNKA